MIYSADKLVELCERLPLAESINQTPEDPFAINYFHNLECILSRLETVRVSRSLRDSGSEIFSVVQVVYVNEQRDEKLCPTIGIRLWYYATHRVSIGFINSIKKLAS